MAFKLHPDAKKKGKITIDDKKVITGEGRLSYASLFKQKTYKGKEIGYGTSLLFSKDDDISDLEIAASNAAIEKWGADRTKWPSKMKLVKGVKKNICLVASPFHDGDAEKPDKPEYENMIFISANNKKNQPGVIGHKKVKGVFPDLTEKDIKSGDYVRCSLLAFAFGDEGDVNIGIGFALMNVQKLRTGESFGGGRAAGEDFDEVESEDDDADDMDEDDQDEDEDSDEDEDEDEDEEETRSSKKSSKKKSPRY